MQDFYLSLSRDPKYRELSIGYTQALDSLKSYLGDEHISLLLDYEQTSRELCNYVKNKSLEKISDFVKVI